MYLPPPEGWQYTPVRRPGMLRSTSLVMLASVGMPTRFACSSPGLTSAWKIGSRRWVMAVIRATGNAGWATPM